MQDVLNGILDILENLNRRVSCGTEVDDEGGNWEPGRRCSMDIQALKTAIVKLKAQERTPEAT